MAKNDRSEFGDAALDAVFRALLGLVFALPYAARVRFVGWLAAHVLAPLAGWRRRIRANLAHARPDLPPEEVRRLLRAVPDNVGRSIIEIYSGRGFKARLAGTPLTGAGVPALAEAHAAGRPVILVTAHLGNFDALRATLFAHGYPLAALYRPMNNRRFNSHYIRALSEIGTPLFPRSRSGIVQYVRHLADGGIVGILTDLYSSRGPDIMFFGQPAPTSPAACTWALRYDALVLPCYGIRRPNGLDFDVIVEAPVPHGDPVAMTQEITDRLEATVREHMEQWFWIHDRWKPDRREAPS